MKVNTLETRFDMLLLLVCGLDMLNTGVNDFKTKFSKQVCCLLFCNKI